MAFIDDFGEALGELASDPDLIGDSFNWAGNDYVCLANGARRGGKLENFGFQLDQDLVITVEGSLFGDGARPARGQTLICRGVTYRIDEAMTAPGSAFLRLACVNASRGI